MTLWLMFALMTAAAVFAVWWPLARRQGVLRSGNDVAVYRDQIDEIAREEAVNLIGKAEAEAARVEVSRRLIAAAEAARASSATAPAPASVFRQATLIAGIALLTFGAGTVYVALGSPNLKPVSMITAAAGPQGIPSGVAESLAKIEAHVKANPGDGRAWEVLAPVYVRLERYDDAVTARRKALEIFGPDAARLGDLGEAIYLASGGVVTAEAKDLFLRAEAADRGDVMAQYYLGVSAKQEGNREEAAKRWNGIIAQSQEGADYLPLIRRALAEIDNKQGPAAIAAPQPPPSSPAGAPPADHSGDAINAMVQRLAERLKNDGSDISGWIQLVRSYRTLGKADQAEAAIANARAALTNDPEALKQLEEGLRQTSTP